MNRVNNPAPGMEGTFRREGVELIWPLVPLESASPSRPLLERVKIFYRILMDIIDGFLNFNLEDSKKKDYEENQLRIYRKTSLICMHSTLLEMQLKPA